MIVNTEVKMMEEIFYIKSTIFFRINYKYCPNNVEKWFDELNGFLND